MQLTQQVRIEPTKEQENVLWDLSEKCRLIYNFALTERKEAHKYGHKIRYLKQQNDLPTIKKKYPEYNWVYSKVLQYTLRNLDADYRSFFALKRNGDKDAQPPKYKGRKYFTTMVYNQNGFCIKNDCIKLSHKHPSGLRLSLKMIKDYHFAKIYQISVYQKDGKFFASITYEKPNKEYADNGLYQAFDLGSMKHTAVNSKGRFMEFINKRPDKYWEKKLESIQSRRDHCKKKSQKWKMLNRNYNKMKRKSSNQLKDFQHKLSSKIIDNTKANTIIVGKLEVKKLSRKNKYEKGLHRSMHNTGNISRFVSFLTYKGELVGKRIIENDERGTTKTCCVCGNKQNMPLYKRVYSCDCGNHIDRDKNSAINIMSDFLSQNALWTGYRQFVDNVRQTGLDISFKYSQEAPSERVG
jgi:putative transposase